MSSFLHIISNERIYSFQRTSNESVSGVLLARFKDQYCLILLKFHFFLPM